MNKIIVVYLLIFFRNENEWLVLFLEFKGICVKGIVLWVCVCVVDWLK